MVNYELRHTRKTKKQLRQLKSVPPILRRAVYSFLDALTTDPYLCISKSKRIAQIGDNCFSKEISRGDRIVYVVVDTSKKVIMLSLFGHYCDNSGKKHMQIN